MITLSSSSFWWSLFWFWFMFSVCLCVQFSLIVSSIHYIILPPPFQLNNTIVEDQKVHKRPQLSLLLKFWWPQDIAHLDPKLLGPRQISQMSCITHMWNEVFLGSGNTETWKFPVSRLTISYSPSLPLSLSLPPLQYVKRKYRKAAVPPKYALELLTIYAWEMGTNKNESFNLDEGFIAVMKLLRDYEDICIYWTKYYDFENEVVRIFIKKQLKECRCVGCITFSCKLIENPTHTVFKIKGVYWLL